VAGSSLGSELGHGRLELNRHVVRSVS
jgi:hypothetical protein